MTRDVVIGWPVGGVFAYVADPHNAPRFISSISRIVSGPEGAPKQGEVWRAEANFLGRPATVALRLAELRPDSLVKFAIEGEPRATLTLRLQPQSEGRKTAVSLHLDVPSVPDIFLNALMGSLLSGDLARLKGVLEKGRQTTDDGRQ